MSRKFPSFTRGSSRRRSIGKPGVIAAGIGAVALLIGAAATVVARRRGGQTTTDPAGR